MRKSLQEQQTSFLAFESCPQEFVEVLDEFREEAEQALNGFPEFRRSLLELYFHASHFCRIFDLYGECHATTTERRGSDVKIKLLCLDPSRFVRQRTDAGRASVFFSATLTPQDYYLRLLGADEDDPYLDIPSPFAKENLFLALADGVSTRYRHRVGTSGRLCEFLSVFTEVPGNYMVFFPSYEYLEMIWIKLTRKTDGTRFVRQERYMTVAERAEFLDNFTGSPKEALVGFVVMGGVFGEGIDLPADRLTGVAVVGVGLPAMSPERDLMREYYENKLGSGGFHFAYTIPGMNRVMQAVGRLIRTESDIGSALLVDDRFSSSVYRRLYPDGWPDLKGIRDPRLLAEELKGFRSIQAESCSTKKERVE